MNIKGLALNMAATALLAASAWAQGRLYDKVVVDLPENTKINDKTLPAGHYEIRQVPSEGASSRVMLVTEDGAKQFDASVTSIPTLDNLTPADTRVIMRRVGQNYYLDKIWISGKNYGYQFVLPAEAREALNEQGESLTLSASYQGEQPKQVAEARPAPQPEPQPEPQASTPPPAQPEPQPEPAPQAAPAPAPTQPPMPATAANWLFALLAGSVVSGAGALLKRRG